jgi:PAS domain S-box-containing protein
MTHGACLINRTERLAEAAELTTYGNGRRAASLMYVPIHSHHTVIGILSLQSYTPGYYSDDDLKLLQALADRCGAALERMQMTEAVRLSEERFRALLETLPIGVALRDANGQLVHANPAYQKMLGYTTDELRQLGIAGIVHPQDVPAVQRLFDTLRQLPHEESQLDLRYRHKDGHVVWGRIWASAIPGADGTATSIVAVVQDVTERRQMELALQERAAIVDHAPDAIIITALDGRIQTWNRAAGRLYGYSEQEVLGRAVSLLCPPERHKEFMILAERMHHGEAIMDFETLRLRKDGTRVEVSLTLSALAEPNGARCGAIGITRDISERKRLEREIAEISRQEQQRLAHELHDQLGAYLAGVAFHVKSHAETLERRADAETPVARELVQMINAAITKTRQFARLLALETGDETMQLADRLSQLQAELQTLFGVTCCLKVSPDLPSLPTDFTRQICLIAREAVRNAIQHGQARFITCTALASPDSLELQIDSDGAPWSPANSAAPGLGLRIMRYRADALGGTLSFPTRDDQRTAVVCTVPLPFSVANASTSTPATP